MSAMTPTSEDGEFWDFLQTGDVEVRYEIFGLTIVAKNFDPQCLDMKAFEKACGEVAKAIYAGVSSVDMSKTT